MNNLKHSSRKLRWWHGLLYFFAALVGNYLLLFLGITMLGLFGFLGDKPEETLFSPQAFAIQIFFTCAILTLLAVMIPRAYGWSSSKWLAARTPSLVVILVSALGVVGLGFLVDEILFVIHKAAPRVFSSDGLDMFNQIFFKASPAAFVLLTAVVSIGPGIGEEFFFRGFLQRALKTDMPLWFAVVLQAVLFGLMHANMLQGVGASLIGLYLGFVAVRTRSIWPCVAAHALNNFLSSMFARYDPGTAGSIWQVGHPLWMVVVATLITAFSIITLMLLTKAQNKKASLEETS